MTDRVGASSPERSQSRRLVQCPDLDSYLQLSHCPDLLVPVLGSRPGDSALAHALGIECVEPATMASRLRSTALAHDVAAAGPEFTSTDYIVARPDAYWPFAEVLARWTGRGFLTVDDDFKVLASLTARRALLLATAEAFSFSLIAEIAALSAQRKGPEIGIITGRSAEGVSRRIARIAFERSGRPGRILHLGALAPKAQPTSAVDQKLSLDTPSDAVLTVSHGSAIDMDLGVAVLCGRSSEAPDPPVYPCRFEQGCRRDPQGNGRLLRVDSLPTRILFAESCNGIAFADGLSPAQVSLALSVLDSPAAFIGTYKLVRSSRGLLPSLADALLVSGYSFGAVTAIANRLQVAIIGDAPSFLLIGDPGQALAITLEPLRASAMREHAEPYAFGADCGGRYARAVEISIVSGTDVSLEFDCQKIDVELTPVLAPEETGIAVLLPEGPTEARLFICMNAPRQFTRVRASFHPIVPCCAIAISLWRGIEILSVIREGIVGKITSPAFERCARDLDTILEQARDLAASVETIQHTDHRHSVLFNGPDRAQMSLQARISVLSREIASCFPNWGLSAHLARAYGHRLLPQGSERQSTNCMICGSPCFEIEHASSRQPLLCRTIRHCPRCGILSDSSASSRPVTLCGPTVIRPGSDASFEWLLPNDQSFPIEISASAVFPHAPPSFDCRFVPDLCTVAVAPKSEALICMRLECGESAPPGDYTLVVAAVNTLSLELAAQPLRITRPE